jgi:hypothetical protein
VPYHDPELQRMARTESARRRRGIERGTRRGTPLEPLLPRSVRIRRANDVRRLLEGQVNDLLRDGSLKTPERARTICYLGLALLKSIEVGDLESRIDGLEQANRPAGGGPPAP